MKMNRSLLLSLCLAAPGAPWVWPCAVASEPATALVAFAGTEIEGGAKDVVGTSFAGEEANTIYAQATGARSRLLAKFKVPRVPSSPMFVHLAGRDDDAPAACAIAVRLNGATVFQGPNQFSSARFATRALAIPENALVPGENVLLIECLEKAGTVGAPPWFQVASLVIGPRHYVIARDLHKQFSVSLPSELKPFPEPLPPGKQPGFRWRGTKGWAWSPEQYLQEIPWLAEFKLNFLMNCYLSMFDLEHHANWSEGSANRWWEDIPAAKKQGYERVVRACQSNRIEFCFGMNPNLASKRFIQADDPEGFDHLYKHYAWMQSLGVKWFNISLDDITQGINAKSHALVVNTIFKRLREKDPQAQMVFCPTYYWGDGTAKDQQPYLETLARELHPDAYLFWTGDAVVGPITRQGAETFRRISGHRLFLWDNYPVSDDSPTMHLGPVIDRAPDLCEVVDGYMSNPHRKQNQGNRIPLATCADYAYNPAAYDPSRSIGQAILHIASTPDQRAVLRDLVDAYSGMLIWAPPQRGTGFNALEYQFERVMSLPHSRPVAAAYLAHLEHLSTRMQNAFPDSFRPERGTLRDNLKVINQKFRQKYP